MKLWGVLPAGLFVLSSFVGGCASSSVDSDDADLTSVVIPKNRVAVMNTGRLNDFGMTCENWVSFETPGVRACNIVAGKGDALEVSLTAGTTGTLWILKKNDAGDYRSVLSKTMTAADLKEPGKPAKIAVQLKSDGKFVMGWEPDVKNTKKTNYRPLESFSMTLGGMPAAAERLWVYQLRQAFDAGEFSVDDLPGITRSGLPAKAKAEFDELNKVWGPDYPPTAHKGLFKSKTVYAVQNSNDGGMTISFYDGAGKPVAGGGAGEATDFSWGY